MPLDRSAKTPLYLQLYHWLKTSYLPTKPGSQQLMSIRKLAQTMHVSKTTVEQAYDQLLAEGYVYTVPGSGYFFNELKAWPQPAKALPKLPTSMPPITVTYDFRYGATQLLTPSWNGWKKAVREALRQAELNPVSYPNAQGLPALRQRLATFLHTTRGVNCQPEQIVITNGAKEGLGLLLSILPAGTLGIENPGYRGLSELAASYGKTTVALPITTKGVSLAALKANQPQYVYTTPTHQFPLGYGMPIAQRLELLQWAASEHRLIIEDDYDSEYRYQTQPLPALQSVATADQVAYLGTFAKGIDPTLRLGYLVLPVHLVAAYHRQYQYHAAMVAGLLQQAMVNYIDSGAYYRHLNRSRSLNRRKYHYLTESLAATDCIRPIVTGAGLQVVVQIPGIEQAALLAALIAADIRIYPLESNWQQMPSHDYYLLGFTSLSLADLAQAVPRLIAVCEQLRMGLGND